MTFQQKHQLLFVPFSAFNLRFDKFIPTTCFFSTITKPYNKPLPNPKKYTLILLTLSNLLNNKILFAVNFQTAKEFTISVICILYKAYLRVVNRWLLESCTVPEGRHSTLSAERSAWSLPDNCEDTVDYSANCSKAQLVLPKGPGVRWKFVNSYLHFR